MLPLGNDRYVICMLLVVVLVVLFLLSLLTMECKQGTHCMLPHIAVLAPFAHQQSIGFHAHPPPPSEWIYLPPSTKVWPVCIFASIPVQRRNTNLLMLLQRAYPPPLVIATQKSQIGTVPTPTAAWTRLKMPRFKKRRLQCELVPERGMLCTNIPKIRAMWVQLGKTLTTNVSMTLCSWQIRH